MKPVVLIETLTSRITIYSRIPKTILNIPGPRYLGNALSSEAIYIGSFHDLTSEVICLKGNLASLKSQNKENAGTRASKRMHRYV